MLFSPPLFMHSCFPPKRAKDETPQLLVLSPDPSATSLVPRPLLPKGISPQALGGGRGRGGGRDSLTLSSIHLQDTVGFRYSCTYPLTQGSYLAAVSSPHLLFYLSTVDEYWYHIDVSTFSAILRPVLLQEMWFIDFSKYSY